MWLGTSDLVPPDPKGQGYSFQVLELKGNLDLVQQFDVLKQQSPIQILTQNSNSQKKAFLLQTEVERSASHSLGILPTSATPVALRHSCETLWDPQKYYIYSKFSPSWAGRLCNIEGPGPLLLRLFFEASLALAEPKN